MQRLAWIAVSAGCGVLLWMSSAAAVDARLDLFGGSAETDDTTVTATYQLITLFGAQPPETVARQVSFERSNLFGVRGRFYLDNLDWFGFGIEGSLYQADGRGVDIDLLPVTGLVFARLPGPVVEPYLAAGLTWAYADVDFDFTPALPEPLEGSASGFGVELRAGVDWLVSDGWGLFLEYRYLELDMEMDDVDDWALFSEEVMEAEFDLSSQMLLGGVSFRY